MGIDPITQQRKRLYRLVKQAKRLGYSALFVSGIGFASALITDLSTWSINLTLISLIAAIIILPVPIVMGYGIKAAHREDTRGQKSQPK